MIYASIDQLKLLFPHTKVKTLESFVEPLNTAMGNGGIVSRYRICAFLAQTGVESGGYSTIKENLNYSAQGLINYFRKYFPTLELAQQYERKPEMIANRVYANRMGNGPEDSGDGWKFRGRGVIQVTGKYNYEQFANERGFDLDTAISYLETIEGACESAVWYWTKHRLNDLADEGDMVTMTKKINGGLNGFEERMAYYHTALSIF